VLTLCHNRDDGTCGGVSSRGGRRRVVRLCVAKRSRRPIRTLCRDRSFPYMARRGVGDARETGNRAGGKTDQHLPSRSGFRKNVKFPLSFANFAKIQNLNAKPLDISI